MSPSAARCCVHFRISSIPRRAVQDHPTVGASLNNLGVAHKSIGDFSKALVFFTKSLTIKLATGGEAAATVNNIAEVHRCLGDNNTALQYYEWAHEIRCTWRSWRMWRRGRQTPLFLGG